MKKLFYEKKSYKDLDDKTASEMGMALIGSPRPVHILVDGEALKSSQIEIRAEESSRLHSDDKVTLEEIKKFEHSFDKWKANVSQVKRSWEFFASVHGLITLVGVYEAPSGMKRVTNYLVRDPARFTRFSKLYAAIQNLCREV